MSTEIVLQVPTPLTPWSSFALYHEASAVFWAQSVIFWGSRGEDDCSINHDTQMHLAYQQMKHELETAALCRKWAAEL